MAPQAELPVLQAFRNAAQRVPSYRTLLREAGISLADVQSLDDFTRLPVLNKRNTFQRFGIEDLCVDGALGRPGTVLTSSGHSGVFAYGITDSDALEDTVEWIDDALDLLFAVRSRPSLLINCLPMGVKVPTRACTLAETSVRPDMVVGLVRAFGRQYAQLIFVGEAAFMKLVLELGRRSGLKWRDYLVHVVLGEEPLAENARRYLGDILGHDLRQPEKGMVFSSMGVAELGLNLFFEVPPVAPLIALRHLLHVDPSLRQAVLGPMDWVPSLFTYDPRRVFVEFEQRRLIVTTLDLRARVPLIRYSTGDSGAQFQVPPGIRGAIEAHGISWEVLESIPTVAMTGRGDCAAAGDAAVYPEAVKEGIYHDAALAELTTANFRLGSGPAAVVIRIQLSPGITPDTEIEDRFRAAISHYVKAPYSVRCEPYERFGNGMALDYERKFQYLER